MAARFAERALIADPTVLRGKRFGNAVLVASDHPLPLAELTRRAASDPHPGGSNTAANSPTSPAEPYP